MNQNEQQNKRINMVKENIIKHIIIRHTDIWPIFSEPNIMYA